MAQERRTPGAGSRLRGSRGPGRIRERVSRSVGGPRVTVPEQRPRLTGRAAILLLVLAMLAVSYASSMRAYLQQRGQLASLQTQIDEREAAISKLEREKRRWNDPAFVAAQARERFGYVMPGETSYVVLDQDGKPLQPQAELPDPSSVVDRTPTAWYETVWDSVELAGKPPSAQAPPANKIDGTGK